MAVKRYRSSGLADLVEFGRGNGQIKSTSPSLLAARLNDDTDLPPLSSSIASGR